MNQSRFSFPPGVAFQPLGDDQDGVMMSLSSGYLYRCNRTACFVLAAISEGKSVDEASNELSQIFGVESSRIATKGYEGVWVKDLSSKNGTWFHGARVEGFLVRREAVFSLGTVLCRLYAIPHGDDESSSGHQDARLRARARQSFVSDDSGSPVTDSNAVATSCPSIATLR